MSDAPYGVYASFRLPGGQLVSSNRETVEQLKKDIEELLGEDGATQFFSAFEPREVAPQPVVHAADERVSVATPVAPEPVVQPAATPSAPSGSPTVDDLPANGFESCEKCGALKDKWKPGGTSTSSGKPYPGFFSCPNWSTHK